MKKIRASGIPQLAGVPFKMLAEVDFIEYQEDTPTENARKLNEREVDLALIPAVDYAVHGGYISLEFGMGSRRKTDSMILYANQSISSLETIHIYQCSSSSMVLLRLLLTERWKTAPRLVRRQEFEPFGATDKHEGVLALHELPGMVHREFRIVEDLGTAWFRHTGLPFVFLIWAARPGVLSTQEMVELNRVFHRSAKASKAMAREYAAQFGTTPELSAEFIGDNRRYYLDAFLLEGLNEFLSRARKLALLPETEYQNVKSTLLGRESTKSLVKRRVQDILSDILEGQRLGIEDGLKIAEEARFSDLAVSAEICRLKHAEKNQVLRIVSLNEGECDSEKELKEKLNVFEQKEGSMLRLLSDPQSPRTLYRYEVLFRYIKKSSKLSIEALSVSELLDLAEKHRMSIEEVVSRLLASGLDLISSQGGEMLLEKKIQEGKQSPLKAEDWASTIRLIHRFGGNSSCCMRVHPDDTWEERLIHLQKLRTLQDENPGFACFELLDREGSGENKGDVSLGFSLRVLMLARLFLDNVPVFREPYHPSKSSENLLSLGLAANRLDVQIQSAQETEECLEAFLKDPLNCFSRITELCCD